MNANQLIDRLIAEETKPGAAKDKVRVLRDERMRLQAALSTGDGVAEQAAQAARVLGMWEGY